MHPERVRGDVDYINASTPYERSRMPLRSAQDLISAEPNKLYVVFSREHTNAQAAIQFVEAITLLILIL